MAKSSKPVSKRPRKLPPGPEPKDYCAKARRYAQQVVNGEIPAGRWVKMACQRQLDDLAKDYGTGWPWEFKEDRASAVCTFLECLPHIKGRWKSPGVELEPWQCFILTAIFGWVDAESGWRRFRTALILVPRKNGKTLLAAGVGLYMLCADGEPGAEVYSAAVTRDQARYCWETAQQMVKREPEMQEEFQVEPLAHAITIEKRASTFKPLSRDADSLEGLGPHCAIVDELHAHKTREVWDVLNVARGSRRQSLLFAISTAGDNKTGICYEQVNYVEQILAGRHRDAGSDRYFGIMYGIDSEDDWTTTDAARKANPNYGVSVLPDDIETMCSQAQSNAHSQNTYLTKRLNVWVSVGTAYFNMLAWENRCKNTKLKIEDFYGDPCILTIDLATKRDLTALLAVFRRGADYYVFGKYYIPSDAIMVGKPNYDFYRGWRIEKLLTVTEGDITDYDFLEKDLLEMTPLLKPSKVGVDPNYNAGQFTNNMIAAGVPMENVAHNVPTFSEPMKDLEALIVAGRVHHNGDPILGWAMANVVAKVDVKGNVYPRKAYEDNKIDPAVALIGNMSLQLRRAAEEPSVYEDRGMRFLG